MPTSSDCWKNRTDCCASSPTGGVRARRRTHATGLSHTRFGPPACEHGAVSSEHDITLSRAQEIVLAHAILRGPEWVALPDAVDRVLAEDVHARADHPPFTNSAMDGWALAARTTPGGFSVVGESAAGVPYAGVLAPDCAVVISTGAPVPDGADAVVPREDAVEIDGVVRVAQAIDPGAFVRPRGDDVAAGDLMLARGVRVAPHHLAVAAATGHAELSCVRRPRVALVVSGGELIPVGEDLRPGQVWDISSTVMPALIRSAGGELVFARAISDDPIETARVLAEALDRTDLVITTGGVSVGDHDHLRSAFGHLGVEEVFWGVRIRPGHPTWFGRRRATRVLALPGNPVAGVVCLWMFARPLMGCEDAWTTLPLAVDYHTPTSRADVIRAVLGPDGLVPCAHQASHQVTSLAEATHVAVVPEGSHVVRQGDRLAAVSLTW